MYFLSIVPWGLAALDWIFGACFHLCLKSKLWFIYLLFVSSKGSQSAQLTFCLYRAVLNLFSKNMSTTVDKFQVQMHFYSMHALSRPLCSLLPCWLLLINSNLFTESILVWVWEFPLYSSLMDFLIILVTCVFGFSLIGPITGSWLLNQ